MGGTTDFLFCNVFLFLVLSDGLDHRLQVKAFSSAVVMTSMIRTSKVRPGFGKKKQGVTGHTDSLPV